MRNIIRKSPLEFNYRLFKKYNCNLCIKREDSQQVRSFKIRGAFKKISNIDQKSKNNGVVCASAGNQVSNKFDIVRIDNELEKNNFRFISYLTRRTFKMSYYII